MNVSSARAPVSWIEYEEIEIEVSPCLCGEREVRILDSIHDRPRERFEPAYDLPVLNRRLEELDELLLSEDPGAQRRRKELAESIGKELYSALLPGRVRRTFSTSLAALRAVRAYRNVGLRLRLSFGQASEYLPEVGLPWELLCSPDSLEFPGSAPETPLVRFLDLERPIEPVTIEPPIRVLAVLAAPQELGEIDLARHRDMLQRTHEKGRLEVTFLEPPTLGGLRDALVRHRAAGEPLHVIHFLGHGAFDDDGEGYLNFERVDSDRGRDRVSGRNLARVMGGFHEVRLAVLATCFGARLMRREGQHPFAGAASALVAGGLPAVVGMQFPISESAAGEFTGAFYRSLAEGRPLEEAVTEGRLGIMVADAGNFEWAAPVLFLRSRNGQVLDLKTVVSPIAEERLGAPEPPSSDVDKGEPQRAGRDLTIIGRDQYRAGRDLVVGKRPRRW